MYAKGLGIVFGIALAAGILFFSLRSADAQREMRDMQPMSMQAQRFQVVKASENEIILLDTFTGELYKAKASDIKAFDAKPKIGFGGFRPNFPEKDRDKDERPRDKERKDERPKDGDKDKERDFDRFKDRKVEDK